MFWLWIIVAILSAALVVPLVKMYTKNGDILALFLAIIFHLVLIVAYVKLLPTMDMGPIYSIIKISSIMLVVLCGLLFFEEKPTANVILGIILGSVAVYLLLSRD